jgi:cytochrome c
MKTLLMILGISAALLAADGSELFKKCAACHGTNGEKVALGKSKIIKDLSKDEIVTALTGYQNGTYGGAMKALMKGQVATLNTQQIETLAEYISAKE